MSYAPAEHAEHMVIAETYFNLYGLSYVRFCQTVLVILPLTMAEAMIIVETSCNSYWLSYIGACQQV